MAEEFLELALSMSSAQLDHDRRPWIVGVGHLMGTPFSEEFSEETFKSALNIAMTTTEFPSGPVRYMPETYVQEVGEDYRLVRVFQDYCDVDECRSLPDRYLDHLTEPFVVRTEPAEEWLLRRTKPTRLLHTGSRQDTIQ